MANFINLNTFEIISGSTIKYINHPDYANLNHPDYVQAVLPEIDKKYWKRGRETIIEMTKAEKDKVDADRITEQDNIEVERLIQEEIKKLNRQTAISFLVTDGKLNPDGSLKK